MAQRTIIDASFTLGLILSLPYSQSAYIRMNSFSTEETKLIVPILREYECLTGLRRAVSLKWIIHQDAEQMLEDLQALEFQRVAPTPELHRSALRWASRIG